MDIVYDPETDLYRVFDDDYGVLVGTITQWDGPGWIITLGTKFLDAQQAAKLGEWLTALNAGEKLGDE